MNMNRVSATITKADEEAVIAAIDTIGQKLPFLIDLTTTERVAITKLSDKSQAFVRKALEVAAQNQGMLPVSFSLEEMRKDAELFERLSTIRIALDKLTNKVDDTTMQTGAEAYAAARAVYAATKTPYATPALRTAADELSRNFRGKRRAAAAAANGSPSPASPDSTIA